MKNPTITRGATATFVDSTDFADGIDYMKQDGIWFRRDRLLMPNDPNARVEVTDTDLLNELNTVTS